MTCTSRLTCGFIGVHAQISPHCTSHRVPLMSLLAHNKETPAPNDSHVTHRRMPFLGPERSAGLF